jgi:hypothetical protein
MRSVRGELVGDGNVHGQAQPGARKSQDFARSIQCPVLDE